MIPFISFRAIRDFSSKLTELMDHLIRVTSRIILYRSRHDVTRVTSKSQLKIVHYYSKR